MATLTAAAAALLIAVGAYLSVTDSTKHPPRDAAVDEFTRTSKDVDEKPAITEDRDAMREEKNALATRGGQGGGTMDAKDGDVLAMKSDEADKGLKTWADSAVEEHATIPTPSADAEGAQPRAAVAMRAPGAHAAETEDVAGRGMPTEGWGGLKTDSRARAQLKEAPEGADTGDDRAMLDATTEAKRADLLRKPPAPEVLDLVITAENYEQAREEIITLAKASDATQIDWGKLQRAAGGKGGANEQLGQTDQSSTYRAAEHMTRRRAAAGAGEAQRKLDATETQTLVLAVPREKYPEFIAELAKHKLNAAPATADDTETSRLRVLLEAEGLRKIEKAKKDSARADAEVKSEVGASKTAERTGVAPTPRPDATPPAAPAPAEPTKSLDQRDETETATAPSETDKKPTRELALVMKPLDVIYLKITIVKAETSAPAETTPGPADKP
jgi:hypothetical protein